MFPAESKSQPRFRYPKGIRLLKRDGLPPAVGEKSQGFEVLPFAIENPGDAPIWRDGDPIGKADVEAGAQAEAVGQIVDIPVEDKISAGLVGLHQVVDAGRDLKEKAFFKYRFLFGPGGTIAVAEEVERVDVGSQVKGQALPLQFALVEKSGRVGPIAGKAPLRKEFDPGAFQPEPII